MSIIGTGNRNGVLTYVVTGMEWGDMVTTERTFDSRLVGWCPDCKYHIDAKEIGVKCDSLANSDCSRTLVKRRMWVCSVKDCSQAYKKLEDAKNHDCYSAY